MSATVRYIDSMTTEKTNFYGRPRSTLLERLERAKRRQNGESVGVPYCRDYADAIEDFEDACRQAGRDIQAMRERRRD